MVSTSVDRKSTQNLDLLFIGNDSVVESKEQTKEAESDQDDLDVFSNAS